MRLGVLADIHGEVEALRKAIERLRQEQVDQFVVLGDVIFDQRHASETVALLEECHAIGVWGNHELGLCVEPDDEIRELFAAPVMRFFSTLTSHLELGGVLFSHNLPSQDASDPYEFYLGKKPDDQAAIEECFAQFPHQLMMIGHFHRWLAATPKGRLAWEGDQPISLETNQRYFFVINAVMHGWTAVVDTDHELLIPIRL